MNSRLVFPCGRRTREWTRCLSFRGGCRDGAEKNERFVPCSGSGVRRAVGCLREQPFPWLVRGLFGAAGWLVGWLFSVCHPDEDAWWGLCLAVVVQGVCSGLLVGCGSGCCGRVCGGCFDSWIVCASILYLWWPSMCGIRWMPWHQAPMKDVGGRDSPRGAVNRAVIRGCPNGGT